MATATQAPEAAVALPAGSWNIDKLHSDIGFEVKHFGISTFRGRFSDYEGTIVTDESGLRSVEGTIEAGSIDIADEQLSGHLRSEDFFHVEKYPQARYVSTSVESAGDGRYRVNGEFTLRGVTRPLTLDAQAEGAGAGPDGKARISLSASGQLDRLEYGLSFDAKLEGGAAVVGEKVRLVLSVEAVQSE